MTSITVEIPMSAELVDAIARRVVELNPAKVSRPFTVKGFAEASGMSESSIYRMLEAGELRRVPGVSKKLIPVAELARFE